MNDSRLLHHSASLSHARVFESKERATAHSLLVSGMFILSLNYLLYWAFGLEILRAPIRIAAIPLFLLSALMNLKLLSFEIAYLPMLGITSLALFLHGGEALNMLVVLLFVLAASPYSSKVLISDLLKCFIALIGLYAIGVATGNVSIASYVFDGRVRNKLGFSHVNAAALFFLPLLLLLYKKMRHRVMASILVAMSFVILFIETNTRSILVTSVVFLIAYGLFFAMGKHGGLSKYRGVFGLLVLYGIVVMTAIIPFLAGTELDYFLSYRPTLFYQAVSDFTPSDWLFGSTAFQEVDNLFFVVVGHYGIVYLALMVFTLHKAVLRCARHGDAWGFSFLLAMLACSFVESFLFRPELVVTFAFWAIVFDQQPDLHRECVKGNL